MEMASECDVFNAVNGEDDDLDEQTLQSQAFAVPNIEEGEDLSAPPMTGEEYLKRVIMEAKQCEAVLVAKVKTKKQDNVQFPNNKPSFIQHQEIAGFKNPLKISHNKSMIADKENCNSQFCLDKDTQLSTLASFSKLRLELEVRRKKIPVAELKKLRSSMPTKSCDEAWLKIFLKKGPDLVESAACPSMKLCLAMSQPKIWAVLSLIVYWKKEGELSLQEACCWTYCLLACLELPVDSDVYFNLRAIARALIKRRSQLVSLDDEELPHINLMICIIGRYFGQSDLADPLV